ncbi:hypothetical protein PMG11_10449 [Penicillium brasilianum]|uniref:Cytochrome P450 monooxygenase poxM n=1 Tax=Penicillium brasilianum TaxID=104259 RepID=A0A0F7TZB5_PENBI|nr:hypothetical protein PMG11_10449 [Penicillium brasilianum]
MSLPWLILSGFGVFATVVVCLYRLYFHPYAKYPGPFLAKLTNWYAVYHTFIEDVHTDIWACHEKYGDIVRYGPNRIVFNTEPGLKAIYGHGANVHKSKGYEKVSLLPGVHASISTIDNGRHKLFRRLLNQGLSDTNIRLMDAKLRKVAVLFARALGEEQDRHDNTLRHLPLVDGWSIPKNMAHWCDYFTFDVMSELVFGTSYNLLGNSENHFVIDGIIAQMQRFGFLLHFPGLEKMKLHHILFPQARRKATRFYAKSRKIMEERKARGDSDNGSDVFRALLTANDPETGESFSNQQLWVESNLLIIAGSDTSSTGMAALFFYLSQSPAAYARVTEEVRMAFSESEVCQGPKLSSCVYLRACIQEALRLCPPVTGPLWREVLEGGLFVPQHNIQIPAGCEVGTGIWSLNHSPKYYPRPHEFCPERWIPEEIGTEHVGLAKAAFASFSVGPRNCVGKGLAITEIMLGMATVIAQYDFRRAEPAKIGNVGEGKAVFKGQFQTFWGFTMMKTGPFIQFRPIEINA